MARDYKQKHYASKQPYQRRSQQTQQDEIVSSMKWVWMMALVVTAALLGGFFVVQHFAQKGVKSAVTKENASQQAVDAKVTDKPEGRVDDKKTSAEKPAEQKVFEAASAEPKKAEPKVHYSFYKGLAETEVVVDAEPISVELPSPYYIQAGTFTTKADALKEQKRLAKFNQPLLLSSLQYKGRTYFRLRLGPFTDRLVMNRKRNELRKLGVDTLLIRGKKPSPKSSQDTHKNEPVESTAKTSNASD